MSEFTRRHAAELNWFFAEGLRKTIPGGIDYEKKQEAATRTGSEPVYEVSDGDLLVRVGRIDRALYAMPRLYCEAVCRAYGDEGHAATDGGLDEGERWWALAPMTEAARAPALARREAAGPEAFGDPFRVWARELREAARKGQRDDERYRVRREALGLLRDGESLFAEAYNDVVAGEAAVRRAGARRGVAS